jgi:hypothetical protein
MRKLDDIFPNLGFMKALIVVIVLAIALELSGAWITMLIAGAFGGLFTRKTSHAFLVGLLGVGLAWGVLFLYLSMTAQAMAIANIFIGLLGLHGMGWLVFFVSILIGALLGGFGGLLGRSLAEVVDERSGKGSAAATPA